MSYRHNFLVSCICGNLRKGLAYARFVIEGKWFNPWLLQSFRCRDFMTFEWDVKPESNQPKTYGSYPVT